MIKVKFKAKNKLNEYKKGCYFVRNLEALIEGLKADSFYLIEYKIKKKNLIVSKIGESNNKNKKVSLQNFVVELEMLISSGVPVLKSLEILENSKLEVNLKLGISDIKDRVFEGEQLYKAMEKNHKIFPVFMCNLIRVGEESGKLTEILKYLGEHYGKECDLKRRVQNSLIYPTLVMLISIISINLIIFQVLPTFIDMFSQMNIEIPMEIIVIKEIFSLKSQLILYGVIGSLIIGIKSLKNKQHLKISKGINKVLLQIRLVKRCSKIFLSESVTRNLGILLKSGIPISVSFDMICDMYKNTNISQKVFNMQRNICNGSTWICSFKELELFNETQLSLIEIAENTGKLDETLLSISKKIEGEIDYKILKFTKLFEPALIIILATIIGTLIINLFLPLLNMMDKIGG